LIIILPGHVARAVAQFRGHKELAAAAEHALAVEDFEATAPEEVMGVEDGGRGVEIFAMVFGLSILPSP